MAEFRAGNNVVLLESGTEYFPALERAIHAAQYEVHLETYIFAADETGRRIADALISAARRGVQTNVVVDGFGTRDFLPQSLIDELNQAGVQLIIYRPEVRRLIPQRHRLRRLHRKIAMIDGRIGFVGGINIIDDMHTPRHTPPRFDYAVQVSGPIVADMREAAYRLWKMLYIIYRQRRWHSLLPDDAAQPHGGQVNAALLVRDNLAHRTDIEEAYLDAISHAREEIIIACAYFFPGTAFRRALIDAAQRGVRVVLLLQARVEYVWLHYAARALYGVFLNAGVEIVEYHRSFMHAKVAVIDQEWATVGSSNIDPFSLLLSREANVVVRDRAFAGKLRDSLQSAMSYGARQVERDNWRRRPLPARTATWIAYGVGRLVMGMLGVSQK